MTEARFGIVPGALRSSRSEGAHFGERGRPASMPAATASSAATMSRRALAGARVAARPLAVGRRPTPRDRGERPRGSRAGSAPGARPGRRTAANARRSRQRQRSVQDRRADQRRARCAVASTRGAGGRRREAPWSERAATSSSLRSARANATSCSAVRPLSTCVPGGSGIARSSAAGAVDMGDRAARPRSGGPGAPRTRAPSGRGASRRSRRRCGATASATGWHVEPAPAIGAIPISDVRPAPGPQAR